MSVITVGHPDAGLDRPPLDEVMIFQGSTAVGAEMA